MGRLFSSSRLKNTSKPGDGPRLQERVHMSRGTTYGFSSLSSSLSVSVSLPTGSVVPPVGHPPPEDMLLLAQVWTPIMGRIHICRAMYAPTTPTPINIPFIVICRGESLQHPDYSRGRRKGNLRSPKIAGNILIPALAKNLSPPAFLLFPRGPRVRPRP